jgi:AraC family transcriptional regulator
MAPKGGRQAKQASPLREEDARSFASPLRCIDNGVKGIAPWAGHRVQESLSQASEVKVMKIQFFAMLLAFALPAFASADCGSCCEEGDPMDTNVSKATSPAIPEAADMQSFDGSVAPSVVELKPQRYAVFKGTLADPQTAWQTMIAQVAAQGLQNDEARAWSIIPKMPTSAENMDPNTAYWPAFTIKDSLEPSGDLSAYTTPGGKYVMAAHRGPYEKLGETWGKFAAFIFHNANVDLARPALEFYYSDPGKTKPEDVVTLLYIPIQ